MPSISLAAPASARDEMRAKYLGKVARIDIRRAIIIEFVGTQQEWLDFLYPDRPNLHAEPHMVIGYKGHRGEWSGMWLWESRIELYREQP